MQLSVEDQAVVHGLTALVMSERVWAREHQPVIVSTVAELLPRINRKEPAMISLQAAFDQVRAARETMECAAAWHRLSAAIERHHLLRLHDARLFLKGGGS